MHAPAAGQALAERIAGGQATEIDLQPFSASRFAQT
jgi:glycine/D-amino acid oxidase-like deaminating enzyme